MMRKRLMNGRYLDSRWCVNLGPSLRWDDDDAWRGCGISCDFACHPTPKPQRVVIPDGCPDAAAIRAQIRDPDARRLVVSLFGGENFRPPDQDEFTLAVLGP